MHLLAKAAAIVWTLFTLGIVLAPPSSAQDDIAGDLLACEALEDKDARLACFEKAVQKLKRVSKPNEALGTSNSASERNVLASRPDTIESKSRYRSSTPNRFTARVVKHWKTPYGKFVVELDNGQIWREIDNNHLQISDRTKTVEIYKGILNNYRLKADGRTASASVRRVR